MSAPDPRATARVVWWAAFGHRDFRLFQSARLFAVLGSQMQSVAIGWQIYAITGRPIDLAWVGLAQFLPAVCLSLVTGHVADRFERRRILVAGYAVMALLSAALVAFTRAMVRGRRIGPPRRGGDGDGGRLLGLAVPEAPSCR